MRVIVRVAVLIFLTFVARDTSLAICQKNFEPVPQSADAVYFAARPALLAITCGSEVGTGYLIDADQGFVITVFHVVKLHGDHPITATVLGWTDRLTLKFVHAIQDRANDGIALLQIDPLPEDIRHRHALELVDITPRAGAALRTLGYPQLKKSDGTLDPKRDLIPLDAQFERVESDHTLRISGLKRAADSGSPLLDQYGRVLGTCIKSFTPPDDAPEAFYIPTLDAFSLLPDIPLSARMRALDAQIRAGVDPDTLATKLVNPDGSCCTNLELLLWSRDVATARDTLATQYQARAELLDCPMAWACEQRQVYQASRNLRGYLKPVVAGRAALHVAQERVLAKRPAEEIAPIFDEARTLLAHALGDRVAANPSGVERVVCKAGPDTIAAIRAGDPGLSPLFEKAKPGKEDCDSASGDTPTYYLLHDYTVAALGAETYAAVKRDSAIAAAAATFFAATNEDQEALAFGTIGDAFALNGQHVLALKAYAGAFRRGLDEDWLSENWTTSAKKALGKGAIERRTLSLGIAESPTLDLKKLKTAINF